MKKILLLIVALLLTITLFACEDKKEDEKVYNTNVPTGSLTDATYASLGEYTLTEKELYIQMRGTGYSQFVEELIKKLIPAAEVNAANTDAIKELVDESCYGTSDTSTLNASTKKTYVEKFIDNMALLGIKAEKDNIYTEEVLAYFAQSLGYEQYAKSLLTNENSKYYYANETYTEDDEEVTNSYYISEDDIEEYYNTNVKNDFERKGAVIAFHNLVELEFYFDSVQKDEQTDSYSFDTNRFSTAYSKIYGIMPTYTISADDFALLPESIQNIYDNLAADSFTCRYKEADGLYFILYKQADIKAVDYEDIDNDKKNEVIDEMIDEKITSTFISTATNEALEAADITIYDGLFDALFSVEHEDHERLELVNWKDEYKANVAKVNDKYLTVAELNDSFKKTSAIDSAILYFTNKVIINYTKDSSYKYQLTSDEIEDLQEEYESALKAFKNDENSNYPASIGVDNFNFLYYGASSEDEVMDLYKANALFEKIKDGLPENIVEILEEVGKDYYETYYNLKIKHVLFMFDTDYDGNPDDPEIAFGSDYQTVYDYTNNLFVEVANEVEYLVDTKEYCDLSSALDYVCKQFNAGEKIEYKDASWNEYKLYGISMKVEDLSSVSTSNGSSYVSEFSAAVQALYNKLGDEASKDYVDKPVEITNPTGVKTSYGIHFLTSYGTTEITSAKYEEESDTASQYKGITSYYNADKNVDDQGKVIGIDSYSSNAWASQNQIKLYLEYKLNEGSSSNIYSKAKTFIEYFYSSFMTKYQSDDFQTILFAATELKDINFANSSDTDSYTQYMDILMRQFDSYADNSNNMYKRFWVLTGVKTLTV